MICGCGEEIVEPTEVITAAGGWCVPSEIVYEVKPVPMCGDCKARMLMMTTIGIDPGPKGAYLKVPRGGIRYS